MAMQTVIPDPLALMLSYHGEVRRVVDDMKTVVEDFKRHDAESVAQMKVLAASIVYQLGMRRIIHERDEVDSLIPKLKQAIHRDGVQDKALNDQIDHMSDEHMEWEAAWRPIQFWLWMVSADDPILDGHELEAAQATLEAHLVGHIEAEERTVYAAAKRLLSEQDWAEIAEEMAQRRQRFGAWGPVRVQR